MISFKEADSNDLEAIVNLLANDELGRIRENASLPLLSNYIDVFHKIKDDPNAYLFVGVSEHNIIAVAQLNILHYLTYQGGSRALIEGVRVHHEYRGKGIGKIFFQYLIEISKDKGCHLVQLTTDKKRPEAYKFYENLGFKATHEGFKLHL